VSYPGRVNDVDLKLDVRGQLLLAAVKELANVGKKGTILVFKIDRSDILSLEWPKYEDDAFYKRKEVQTVLESAPNRLILADGGVLAANSREIVQIDPFPMEEIGRIPIANYYERILGLADGAKNELWVALKDLRGESRLALVNLDYGRILEVIPIGAPFHLTHARRESFFELKRVNDELLLASVPLRECQVLLVININLSTVAILDVAENSGGAAADLSQLAVENNWIFYLKRDHLEARPFWKKKFYLKAKNVNDLYDLKHVYDAYHYNWCQLPRK